MSQWPVAVLNWLLCGLVILGMGSLTVGGRACGARPRQHEGGGQDCTRQDATRPLIKLFASTLRSTGTWSAAATVSRRRAPSARAITAGSAGCRSRPAGRRRSNPWRRSRAIGSRREQPDPEGTRRYRPRSGFRGPCGGTSGWRRVPPGLGSAAEPTLLWFMGRALGLGPSPTALCMLVVISVTP
jgi:hypothetical protein